MAIINCFDITLQCLISHSDYTCENFNIKNLYKKLMRNLLLYDRIYQWNIENLPTFAVLQICEILIL